ncbi:MAG: hypothetical protein GY863_16915 [bacterium]|nr:hypothetical protein [bacterium]
MCSPDDKDDAKKIEEKKIFLPYVITYRLLILSQRLSHLLEQFFSGDSQFLDDSINIYYLRFIKYIESLLKSLEKHDPINFYDEILNSYSKPFTNLRLAYKYEWEQFISYNWSTFVSLLEEEFVSEGERKYKLSDESQEFLDEFDSYMKEYLIKKKSYENPENEQQNILDDCVLAIESKIKTGRPPKINAAILCDSALSLERVRENESLSQTQVLAEIADKYSIDSTTISSYLRSKSSKYFPGEKKRIKDLTLHDIAHIIIQENLP